MAYVAFMASPFPGALKNLEARLLMAVENVAQCEVDLNSARAKAGLPTVEKSFYLAEGTTPAKRLVK
jgi:hypothetical protein